MSVVITSSLGLPICGHETLIVSITVKARTAILFLRISSSALAASERSGGLGATRNGISTAHKRVPIGSYHSKMRQTAKLLPLQEFCWNSSGNAIQPGKRFPCRRRTKKKGGAFQAPPVSNSSSRGLEHQLQSQSHGTEPTAAAGTRIQEVQVARNRITRRCGGRSNPRGPENVSIAKGVVGMVENLENIRLSLQAFAIRKA